MLSGASVAAASDMGGLGFRPVPTPESYINSLSLVRAAHPPELPSRNVYANNANSYLNHVRDNGFTDRYSVDRREMPSYRRAPVAAAQPAAPPSAGAAAVELL